MRSLRLSSAVALDALLVAAACATVAIVAGYGGRFALGPYVVSATSSRNTLTIALVVMVARTVLIDIPFLTIAGLSLAAWPRRAVRWWHSQHERLLRVSVSRATRLVLLVMLGSLAIKLANAYWHFGFWTGDDVEINEMTFSRLFNWRWQAWNLRSPFYPMSVIYPVQALLVKAGLTDPRLLVFSGRLIVALFSIGNLWLTFRVARRVFRSLPIATLSVLVLAANKLHTLAGSTELPRTVSCFFVLAAFGTLLEGGADGSALLAGALVGVGAGMRFSEAMFVVPAVLQLAAARRWRQTCLFVLSFAAVTAIIFGAIDQLYWGEPFFSLEHAIDFTLVKRLSSRGYQPFYAYITSISSWADILVVTLAMAASMSQPVLAVWTWLPVVVLSMLPHKEPRYLIPILPFVSMLAASALWWMMAWLSAPVAPGPQRERAAGVFLAACAAALVLELSDFWHVRSEKAVAIAQYVASQRPIGGVVAEQSWQLGGRLYLQKDQAIVDIDPDRVDDRAFLESSIQPPTLLWVALLDRDANRLHDDSLLNSSGFEEVRLPAAAEGSGYRLFRRRR